MPDELFFETAVGYTASYFVKIIWCSRWFCNPPPPLISRLCIALFAVAEGWLLLDIGWFVLFLYSQIPLQILLHVTSFLCALFNLPSDFIFISVETTVENTVSPWTCSSSLDVWSSTSGTGASVWLSPLLVTWSKGSEVDWRRLTVAEWGDQLHLGSSGIFQRKQSVSSLWQVIIHKLCWLKIRCCIL